MKTLTLIFTICCTFLFSKCESRQNKPIQVNANYQGIDVSNHQKNINWQEVAKDKNVQFVYIKATEGATFVDSMYARNVKGARENGIKVGSYHYLKNTSPIQEQFENFRNVVDKDLQDLLPMVDIEEKVEKDSIKLFCQLIKDYYGKSPVIYGTNQSYNKYCAPDFNNYYLLIARYGNIPPIIKGKGYYNIWQFSDKGRINGIDTEVDLNRLHPDFNLSSILLN